MDALVCKKLGDPSSEQDPPLALITNHPIPQLNSPTSVKIRVTATSLNFANYLQILGKYQEKLPLPFIPGSDFSGVIDSVGASVTRFKPGDRVCAFAGAGTFANFVVTDQSLLFQVPENCDLVAAAALPVAYGTSHVALVHRAQLKPSQVLLVLGAAGGVGVAAAQIGKVCGAIVIAVARGNEKVEFLRSLEIDHVVDSSTENLIASVKSFLKKRNLKGVDVLYDPVGGQLCKDSLKVLNWGAQILIIGFASGDIPVVPTNVALVKNWTVHGLYCGSYRVHRPNVLEDSLNEVLLWMAEGRITIHVSFSFSLMEAGRGFAVIKDRKAIGKVLIVVDGEKGRKSKL